MERVGGVIRHTDNKQIVAWLREGGKVGQTAESVAGVLEQVVSHSGARSATIVRLVAGAVPIIHLAMAGYSLAEHILGIRAHESEIGRIFDRVSEEFQRDREVELLAVIEHAENSFVVTSDAYRHEAVAEITYELAVARGQLIRDLDNLLSAEINPANIELAMQYQVLAMKVCALGVRLRLEVGEDEAAIDWLSKCVPGHKTRARSFIQKWIGRRRALYFHESVDDEYFDRYLDIERWLRERRDVLKDVVRDNRRDFWESEAISDLYSGGINRQLLEEPFYHVAFDHAEVLIENFQRLQGFELELNSMCFPFAQWEVFGIEEISNNSGYAMLVSGTAE